MTIRKLCRPCANDTAVHGRCPAVEVINRPGTICDRCLSDGRLLASYRICCEPVNQWGHTAECRKEQKLEKGMTHPTLQRFAVTLFSTDARVLALTNSVIDDPAKRLATLGRAWDLAADGHEPEATWRKEAEQRAFQLQKFDRELQAYIKETVRLTRESERMTALKAGQAQNARLAPPLPHAEHLTNLRLVQEAETERSNARLREIEARVIAENEAKRLDRAERKVAHAECGAKSPIHPQGRTLAQGGLDVTLYDGERCTRQKHLYGNHQFIVRGRVLSAWNANMYMVESLGTGPIAVQHDSEILARGPMKYEDPPLALGMGQVVKRGGRLDRDPRLEPSFGTNCRGAQCGYCGACKLNADVLGPLTEQELDDIKRSFR